MSHNRRYANMIELSLDNDFAAQKRMKCASYEFANEHILNTCLGRTQAARKVR